MERVMTLLEDWVMWSAFLAALALGVVQVVLHCETLFLRKWTEPLMPASIKKALGIAPAESTAMAR